MGIQRGDGPIWAGPLTQHLGSWSEEADARLSGRLAELARDLLADAGLGQQLLAGPGPPG